MRDAYGRIDHTGMTKRSDEIYPEIGVPSVFVESAIQKVVTLTWRKEMRQKLDTLVFLFDVLGIRAFETWNGAVLLVYPDFVTVRHQVVTEVNEIAITASVDYVVMPIGNILGRAVSLDLGDREGNRLMKAR